MSPRQPKKDLLVLLIVVFLVFVAVISMAGYYFYQNEKRQLLREEIEAIQTVANLKVSQIEHWRQERLADVQVMADNPFLVEHVRHLLEHREELPCRVKFQEWLRTVKNRYHYLNILLLNGQGEILLKAQEDLEPLGPGGKKLVDQVIARPQALFSDLYRNSGAKGIRLSLVAPIVEQRGDDAVLLGIILFRIDPGKFLFPLIQSWPTVSRSAETLLVRREGDEVVYLNELRHRQDTALELRVPLTRIEVPAVQAALGREGMVWGKDYRGVPVLAVIRRIVASPWILVSKVDEGEIFVELQHYALWAGSLVLGLSVIVGLVCILLWRRQQTHYLHDLAHQEAEQKQKLDDILSATPDQMYLMDREGRCLFANRAAVQTLGLDYPELLGHSLRDRGLPAGMGEMLTASAGAVSTSGKPRSGEISFPLGEEKRSFDYIITPLMAEAGTQPAVLATFRDITDRKLAEERLSCLNHLYVALSRAGDVMLKERDPQKLQEEFCRIAVEEGGLRFAWVGRVEPGSEKIDPAAFWGFEEGYLQAMDLVTAAAPDSPCPITATIREGKIGLYQDLEDYVHTARCYQEGLDRGYRSLGVFPLKIGEKVIGVLSFYSALPHFFTPDKVALLTRLSSHLALALEMAAKEGERRQAEDSLRRTSEFLDSILQHAPVPMYVTHRDGHYLLVNPAWVALVQKNREEALGRSAVDLFHPDNARKFTETDQQVLRGGKPIIFEEALKIRGRVYYFQTIKFPLHNDQGDIEAVGGISLDITERRRAEEALRRSEERYRGIFENAPVGMFQSTLEGRYLNINPAMAEMLGYDSPRGVLAGVQSIAHDIYVHPEQRVEILRRLQAGEEVVKTEIPFRRRNGEVRTANAYFRVVREQDRPIHLEGFVEDITERKKAEDNLVAEKQFSDTAIDSLPGLFYLFDDQGRLLRWNRNFERVSGYSPDELLGMQPQDFVRGQEKQETLDAIEEAMQTGEAFLKADFITKDGRAIPHFFTGRRAQIGGKPCLVGTGIDVTELRQAEAALALHNLRLNALLELHRLADAPQEDLLNFALDAALGFMESEYGWVGLVDEAEQMLNIHAWSTGAMAQCRAADKPVHFPITPEAGLWAECLKRRQAVVVNDYQAPQDGKQGLPEGHVPLERFVAIPVFDGSRLVAAAAVANKNSDYTQEDVRALTALLNKLWEFLRRQQMEEALRDSEERYRSIVETALEGVWVLDTEGRTSYVNHRMAEMLGYQPEEMLGRPLLDFMDEDNRRLAEALWAERRQGRYAAHEFCFQRRDRAPLWTIVSSSPLISDAGVFLGAFAMITDISARKQAEEALRDSEEKLRSIFRAAPVGIGMVIDRVFVEVNQRLCDMTGYGPEELIGQSARLLYPDDEEYERVGSEKYSQFGQSDMAEIETRFQCRDGTVINVLLRSTPLDPADLASGVIFTALDITDRKRAEAALALHATRLQALLGLQLLADASQNQLLDYALEASLTTMQSEMGFIGLLDETETVMTIHRWSEKAMNRCALTENPLHYPVAEAGVWADCIRQRQPVLVNDYQAPQAGKKGLPQGHVPIRRFVSIPVCDGGRMVAVAAVANKETDYTEDDVNAFTSLVNKLWGILRRRQMEEALRESEAQYRLLVTNIPAVVARGYKDWSVDVFDEKIEALTGYPLEAFNRRQLKWRDLILAEDLPEVKRIFLEALKSRAPYVREYRIRTRSGDIRWLQERSQIIFDDQVAMKYVSGVLFDISERKRAEAALRESEERFMDVLYASDDAILLIGDNTFIDCNEATARMLGYATRQEFLQTHPSELSLPKQPDGRSSFEKAEEMMRRAYEKGFHRFEWMHRRSNGEDFPVEVSLTPIVHEGRSLLYCVWRDITDRKRAAEALRESEESLRQILEMLPVGVWVADTNGVIIQANPAARSIWGGARYVGPKGYGEYKAWWRSTGEPTDPEDWALSRALTKGETSLNEVIDIEAFDGARKVILNSALPLKNARGEIIKAIAVNQDITERIAFEERLKASLREKEVLLKEVHHRVKNNMQIISSLLRLQSDQVSHPEVQGVFQESQNRIRSMALVHEMLYQSPDLASISLAAYLKNLVNGLFRSFRVDTHQVALALEVADLPLGIDLALSCGLIINELVSNSLKHAFPDNRRGEVSISARRVAPEELLLTVRDTGVGLPPDLDIRKTSSLGLRLVTLLVGQINGSLELDGPPGATFVIRFPVKTHHG
jgi:PAS domain S-box-containing protein